MKKEKYHLFLKEMNNIIHILRMMQKKWVLKLLTQLKLLVHSKTVKSHII